MEKFLEQFAKIPTQQKIIGVIAAIIAIFGLTWVMSVSPARAAMAANEERLSKQDTELLKLQQQAQHRTQYMREVERLKQRLREAEERLPKQAEVPKLLKDIESEAKQSGLRMERFELQAEQQQGDFSAVPVKMSVRGSYHEVAVFLDRLSKLNRIVNVTDVNMTSPTVENKRVVVGVAYTATTYRFLEPSEQADAASGKKKGKQQ